MEDSVRSKTIGIILHDPLLEVLEKACKKDHRKLSDEVRMILTKYFVEQGMIEEDNDN